MANIKKSNQVSRIDSSEYLSLEDALLKKRKENDKALQKARRTEATKQAKYLADFELKLSLNGIEVTNAHRKKALIQYENEKKKLELQTQLEIADTVDEHLRVLRLANDLDSADRQKKLNSEVANFMLQLELGGIKLEGETRSKLQEQLLADKQREEQRQLREYTSKYFAMQGNIEGLLSNLRQEYQESELTRQSQLLEAQANLIHQLELGGIKLSEEQRDAIRAAYQQEQEQREIESARKVAMEYFLKIGDYESYAEQLALQREQEISNKKMEMIAEQEQYLVDLQLAGIELTEEHRANIRETFAKNQHIEDLKHENDLLKKRANKPTKKEKEQTEKKEKRQEKAKEHYTQAAKLREEGGFFNTIGAHFQEMFGMNAEHDRDEEWGKSLTDMQSNMVNGLANIADRFGNEINNAISSYGEYQSTVNTRLQGLYEIVDGERRDINWQSLEKAMTNGFGAGVYFKTDNIYKKLQELATSGVAHNIEQRAFLSTVSEKIASTFDIMSDSLLRIVRLQQADSSAARLGMEASLTEFLNSNFENSEYLNNVFDTVQSSLLDATSLMTDTNKSIEFEYQVQKWLGGLYSVGLSEKAVGDIAKAIGNLGSGNVDALNGDGISNLVVMAAKQANLEIADLMIDGLDGSETNQLLKAIVQYMQEIAKTDNGIVRSQLAETFGLTVSDLVASLNLGDYSNVEGASTRGVTLMKALEESTMTYADSISSLTNQLGKLPSRTSTGEMINNLLANAKYSMATNIASSGALSALWQVTDLIQSVTGGIAIPTIELKAMGTGGSIDLETTVENLMKMALVGIGSIGMIGDVITGLGNAFNPAGMADKFGISSDVQKTSMSSMLELYKQEQEEARKNNVPKPSTMVEEVKLLRKNNSLGITESMSTSIGNSSGDDYADSSLNSAKDSANKEMDAEKSKQEAEMAGEKDFNDIYDYYENETTPILKEIRNSLAKDPTIDPTYIYLSTTLNSHMLNVTSKLDEVKNSVSSISVIGADTANLMQNAETTVVVNSSNEITNAYMETINGISNKLTDIFAALTVDGIVIKEMSSDLINNLNI